MKLKIKYLLVLIILLLIYVLQPATLVSAVPTSHAVLKDRAIALLNGRVYIVIPSQNLTLVKSTYIPKKDVLVVIGVTARHETVIAFIYRLSTLSYGVVKITVPALMIKRDLRVLSANSINNELLLITKSSHKEVSVIITNVGSESPPNYLRITTLNTNNYKYAGFIYSPPNEGYLVLYKLSKDYLKVLLISLRKYSGTLYIFLCRECLEVKGVLSMGSNYYILARSIHGINILNISKVNTTYSIALLNSSYLNTHYTICSTPRSVSDSILIQCYNVRKGYVLLIINVREGSCTLYNPGNSVIQYLAGDLVLGLDKSGNVMYLKKIRDKCTLQEILKSTYSVIKRNVSLSKSTLDKVKFKEFKFIIIIKEYRQNIKGVKIPTTLSIVSKRTLTKHTTYIVKIAHIRLIKGITLIMSGLLLLLTFLITRHKLRRAHS